MLRVIDEQDPMVMNKRSTLTYEDRLKKQSLNVERQTFDLEGLDTKFNKKF